MANEGGNTIESVLKNIAYLESKRSQLTNNLIEQLVRENSMLQQQYKMALKKIEEINKSDKKVKK